MGKNAKGGKGSRKSKAKKTKAPTPSPTRSENCNLFNDYMAEGIWENFDAFESVFNIPNMRGAEVFSVLPDLSSNLADYFEKIDRSEKVDSSDDETYYVEVLTELGKNDALADGMLFGDNGYDNPGHGGVSLLSRVLTSRMHRYSSLTTLYRLVTMMSSKSPNRWSCLYGDSSTLAKDQMAKYH